MISNLDVVVTGFEGGASYSPFDDTVNVPPRRSFESMGGQSATQAYYVVLFHEMIHWTGGKTRLKRKNFGDYAEEELVAELGAVTLMRHFGHELGNVARHAKYLQAWLTRTRHPKASLKRAKAEAEAGVRYILEHGIIRR